MGERLQRHDTAVGLVAMPTSLLSGLYGSENYVPKAGL